MLRGAVDNKVGIIGISGPSGSGKSLIAQSLYHILPGNDKFILQEDAYYKDLSDIPFDERTRYNFDHPDAFDHSLLVRHLADLKQRKSIEHPVYDYTTHTRKGETRKIEPVRVIILEGIMIFAVPELRSLMDLKVYVDTPLDTCFIRRLRRDMEERGRSIDSVIQQYQATVRPMYFKYILPSKREADILVTNDGENVDRINKIAEKIFAEMNHNSTFAESRLK
jgi:uridine kinase